MLTVHAFDRARDLPLTYQYDFGEAVRRHLRLPSPLGADVYEASDTTVQRTAHLTLRGNYAAAITADGRVVRLASIGGAHNDAFDAAVLAAMRAIDSTDQLSMAGAGLPNEDVPIRVEITAADSADTPARRMLQAVVVTATSGRTRPSGGPPPLEFPPRDSETVTPLFSFRVPIHLATRQLAEIPGVGFLRFPSSLLRPGTYGQVSMSFIVDTEGRAELESVQVIDASRREFAQAALEAMPSFRYKPLEVNGCAVRSLTEEPFQFYIPK